MKKTDYGKVKAIENPSFKNVRLVREGPSIKQCTNLKYINNEYINSPNKSYKGFSLVGINQKNGRWTLLRVWGEW